MNLPAEILDHIFSFLKSDPAALRACSESHPSLSRLAEPHLYFHVLLKTSDSSSDRPSNLAQLLSRRPHIAHYIRSLEIQVIAHVSHHIWRNLEEISNILPMLLTLRQIAVNHSSAPLFFQWEAQPKSFCLAFWTCLRLPSMRDVSLTGIRQFPFISLLNNECKFLRGLTLQGCSWINDYTLASVVTDGSTSHPTGSLPFES